MDTKRLTPLPVIFFGKLWNWLTEPLEELPNIGDRRRSVTTTTFLLFAVIAVAIEQMAAGNTPIIALIFLIAGYFLARTRWFKYAALILVFTLIFPSYLVVLRLPDPDANRVLAAFAWVFVPLLLSSLIYSVRATVVISAINFGVLALLPFLRPELNYSILGGALGFFGLVAVILVVVMTQRNEIENDRQKILVASQESLRQEISERERFAEQAHRRADQLAMLNDVSVAISNLKELDNIFNLILEQVKQHFQLDVFFITIYNEKTGKLAFPLTFDDCKLWNEPEKELSKAQRVAQVIRTGEPLLWNRSEDEIRAATNSDNRVGDSARVAASILITPLQVGAKAIGAISVQSYTKNAYSNEQLMLLSALAHQIVIAIENARLFEETVKRTQRLAILNEIGREISTISNLPTLMENVYQQVCKALSVDLFFISLYDTAKNELTFPIMYDAGRKWEQQPSRVLENTFSGKTILTRKPLLINHWSGVTNENESTLTIVGDETRITQSLMFTPMLFGPEAIGVLSVQSYDLNAYTEEDLNLLSGIANQVGVAIQNTRLLEETRQNAQSLLTMNEIGRAVSELTDLPTLLEEIYEQAQKTILLDVFYVGLYKLDADEIIFPIMYDEGKRYEPTQSTINNNTVLSRLRQGAKAVLINRTPEEFGFTNSKNRLGDTSKISASLMIAPLTVGNQVIGVISSQSYTLNAYSENDLNLLTGIANQVAVAIQNTRLLEETRQNAQSLLTLIKVGHAVSELTDLPNLLEVIYEQAKKSIPLDAFYVGLYHPETHKVSFPIMYDENRRYSQEPGPISDGSFLDQFLKGEKASLINRTVDEINSYKNKQQMLGDDNKPSASLMVAPLVSGDQVIGLISAQSYTINAYNEADLNLLVSIANQVSIAIENSRLYTSAQQEILERQKIEEQLRDAEAKYRELVERVPAVIYSSETGAAGRWFYVSPQIEALLGFTSEEWLADPHLWYQQIHPDDREYAVTTEAKLLAENSSLETEYRMYAKNGRLLWIHDESMNVSISDNQLYVVQGILTDVTVRKQAELTLKENEEKYHSLFITTERQARELTLLSEVQSALAQELDLSDLIHTVVEAIAKTFGYIFVSLYKLENGYLQLQHQVGYQTQNVIEKISPKEGISGKVVHTGHPVLIKDVTQTPDFLRASPHIHSEICVPLFDGDEIFGTLNVESSQEYQLTEDDLRLMQALSEQVNIAIRRARLYADRAESLRRERHINEFAHAISSTLDLSSILEIVARLSVELVGAETGAVSTMSDDGTEMTNVYSYNEDSEVNNIPIPKGQGLTWLVYEKARPIVVDEYALHPNASPEWSASGLHAFMGVPIMAGEKRLGTLALYNRTREKKFTQRDVSLIEALAQEVAISIQNARLFVALQKELTDHKQTQTRLQVLVHELEAKNAELERFTYSVSHDLKSPLVTIGGFLGFLEADIQKGEVQRIENTINRIREAAKKMQRLLDEILELSRIGRLINPPAEVPFGELVSEALELVHGQLTEKQVEVKVEAELPIVNVDRIRMVEVLQNLIANATKFTRHAEKPVIEIGTQIINEQQTFFVKDNGIGIAPEYHQKVFGLFDKLDAKSEGTGIGLALVKRIIEVHGGTIWVESETEKGATFFFTLEPKKQQENL